MFQIIEDTRMLSLIILIAVTAGVLLYVGIKQGDWHDWDISAAAIAFNLAMTIMVAGALMQLYFDAMYSLIRGAGY